MKSSLKRILMLTLCIALVFSLMVFPNAAVTPETKQVVAENSTVEIPLSDLSLSNKTYTATIKLYADKGAYDYMWGGQIKLHTDSPITLNINSATLPGYNNFMPVFEDKGNGDYLIAFAGVGTSIPDNNEILVLSVPFTLNDPTTFTGGSISVTKGPATDFSMHPKGGTMMDEYALADNEFIGGTITIEVAGYDVHYELGKGTGLTIDDESYQKDAYVTVADGTGLSYTENGDKYVFDKWTSAKTVDGKTEFDSKASFKMPEENVTLTATYGISKDEDPIPDSRQWPVTYVMRSSKGSVDRTSMTIPTLVNKTFYDTNTTNTETKINITKGEQIGTYYPGIYISTQDASDGWEELGYSLKADPTDADIMSAEDLAKYVPTGPTTIYVCTKLDKDKGGEDDRDECQLIVTDNDGKGKVVFDGKFPKDTPYEVQDKDGHFVKDGKLETDPTNVPVNSPAYDEDGNPLDRWSVEKVDGKIIIKPLYKAPTTTPIVPTPGDPNPPEIVIPTPEDPEPDPKPTPTETPLPVGSIVIVRDINGKTISSSTVTETPTNVTLPLIPYNEDGKSVPAKDSKGNPFANWVMTEQTLPTGAKIYYIDPSYSDPINAAVEDPDGEELWSGVVPDGTPVKFVDENGKPLDKQPDIPLTKDEPTAKIPEGTYPDTNTDGGVLDPDQPYKVKPVDTNNDGITDYVLAEPNYGKPKLEIITDPNETNADLHIMAGKWVGDNEINLVYYMRIGNHAVTADELKEITFSQVFAYQFAPASVVPAACGIIGTPRVDGSKIIGGKTYTTVVVPYTVLKSSVLEVTGTYDGKTATGNHTVVTVGDCNKNGTLNTADASIILRTSLKITGFSAPEKLAEGNFVYELMDMNKNDTINTTDASIGLRMSVGVIADSN